MKRETRPAPPEKQVNSLSDDRMNAMNQDNDPMEQEEPMLPEDDGPIAFRRSFCFPDAGVALLRNWPDIKKALLNHIKDVEETKVLLDDFTV